MATIRARKQANGTKRYTAPIAFGPERQSLAFHRSRCVLLKLPQGISQRLRGMLQWIEHHIIGEGAVKQRMRGK